MGLSPKQLEKLLTLPLFKGLSQAEAAAFFEVATSSTAKAGTVLFKEDAEGDSLVVVLSGEVQVTRRGVELARIGANSVLGEMSIVGPGEKRSATATALSDLDLLTVPARRVQELLKANNLAALKVVANVAAVLRSRLAMINEKFVDSLGGGKAGTKKREELADFGRILNSWDF
jgi:CRP-like cAMP-binding protein